MNSFASNGHDSSAFNENILVVQVRRKFPI